MIDINPINKILLTGYIVQKQTMSDVEFCNAAGIERHLLNGVEMEVFRKIRKSMIEQQPIELPRIILELYFSSFNIVKYDKETRYVHPKEIAFLAYNFYARFSRPENKRFIVKDGILYDSGDKRKGKSPINKEFKEEFGCYLDEKKFKAIMKFFKENDIFGIEKGFISGFEDQTHKSNKLVRNIDINSILRKVKEIL